MPMAAQHIAAWGHSELLNSMHKERYQRISCAFLGGSPRGLSKTEPWENGASGIQVFVLTFAVEMGGCQNYGPFLGALNNRCRITIGTQKGTIILTTTEMCRNNRLSQPAWNFPKPQSLIDLPQSLYRSAGRATNLF